MISLPAPLASGRLAGASTPVTIAALYVDERGPYVGLPGVDAWGISRDARLYAGPEASEACR